MFMLVAEHTNIEDEIWNSIRVSMFDSVWDSIDDSIDNSIGGTVWISANTSVYGSVRGLFISSIANGVIEYEY
jgi:hypothetical protein